MKKRFNVTGVCIPGQHYMADRAAKFAHTLEMVEEGKYFAINRPRQYGKTTTLFNLMFALQKKGYMVFNISFEGVGDIAFSEEAMLSKRFLDWLVKACAREDKDLSVWLSTLRDTVKDMEGLSTAISLLAEKTERKIVLLIDEVDKSSNNQLFVSFLGMLRDKYLRRHLPGEGTFHSVVLAGVHDVKSLKLKIRPEDERKLNSPWNIAADFKTDMNLSPEEIKPMLEEYAGDSGVSLDAQALADRLFYYTSGHPFLVSKLCKMFDEEMLPEKAERVWTTQDVDWAARQLTQESNVNFDDLSKNLDNNEELYRLTQDVALNNRKFPFNVNDAVANLGILYGIFANRDGQLAIHNRIYQEVITSKMSFRAMRLNGPMLERYDDAFWLPGNRLDLRKVLLKFQELMRDEQSEKTAGFLEREGRLLFLAFLKPVLNGHGYALKEPQISEEKRLDVFVAYHEQRYVVELKLWYGQNAHEQGLDQLAAYLDSLGMDEGYLLIFDHRKGKVWKHLPLTWKGKNIFAVWV